MAVRSFCIYGEEVLNMKLLQTLNIGLIEAGAAVGMVIMAVSFCVFLFFCYKEYKKDLKLKAMDRREERFERRITHEAIREAAFEEIKRSVANGR